MRGRRVEMHLEATRLSFLPEMERQSDFALRSSDEVAGSLGPSAFRRKVKLRGYTWERSSILVAYNHHQRYPHFGLS